MDNNPSSPLDTLRQLKEMLDAGALTPAEFEALKQRLVLHPGSPLPPVVTTPVAPAPPVPASAPPVVPPAVPPTPPTASAAAPPLSGEEDLAASSHPAAPAPPVPSASSAFTTAGPVPPVAAAEPRPEAEPKWTGDEFPALAEETPARNPLALVLSIGGVLVFLAVVAYLTLNRPPSEHISSTSQTAADSLATTIDTGPQAEPLPAPAAEPETIRVAPTNPAPALPSRAEQAAKAAAVRDSAQSATPPVATDSAAQ